MCDHTLRTVVPRGAAGGALSLYLLSVPVSWVGVVGAEAQHRRVLAQWATFITGGRFRLPTRQREGGSAPSSALPHTGGGKRRGRRSCACRKVPPLSFWFDRKQNPAATW